MTQAVNQIERDLADTRRDMVRTFNELQTRVSPGRVLNAAFSSARRTVTEGPRSVGHEISSFGKDFASGLGGVVRGYPIPVAMVAIGLAWLMIAGQRRKNHRVTAGHAGHAAPQRTVPYGDGGDSVVDEQVQTPDYLSREN